MKEVILSIIFGAPLVILCVYVLSKVATKAALTTIKKEEKNEKEIGKGTEGSVAQKECAGDKGQR